MKLAKSILGPVRATRDFSFLRRRLRSNASPFGRKRSAAGGAAFEGHGNGTGNSHEPSSPKVTCIGQVRVKSKRKAKKQQQQQQCRRSLSKRGSFGEASFRKMDHQSSHAGGMGSRRSQPPRTRNQRWVHLPISSICEALRGFGADFCCWFPCSWCSCSSCRCSCSSCFSSSSCSEKGKCCCGNGICKWVLCVSDGGGRNREIELVVEASPAAAAEESVVRSSRRHVFDDIEVRNGRIEVKGQLSTELEEEPARVSICLPPKNALLLMRCRSDPMKMAALANRISWAANIYDDAEETQEEEQDTPCEEDKGAILADELDQVSEEIGVVSVEEEPLQNELVQHSLELESADCDPDESVAVEVKKEESLMAAEENQEEEEEEEEEVESNMSSFEALLDQENNKEQFQDSGIQPNQEATEKPLQETETESISITQEEELHEQDIEDPNQKTGQPGQQIHQENETNPEKEAEITKKENEGQSPAAAALPDCLLLMMCEPKLSMEVSKETWVRGTDFIRWLPARKPHKTAKSGGCCHHEAAAAAKRRPPNVVNNESKPPKPSSINVNVPKKNDHHLQPPRSSCSSMIEQKMVAGGTYEPLALTRCKSEPMRTAGAKLMPDSCFWKNASLKTEMEPHKVGVGAAGIS